MKNVSHNHENLRKALLLIMFITMACLFTKTAMAFSEVKYVRDISEHLKKPVDSVVSQEGDVYVLDKTLSRIFVFNANGQLKFSFGEKGSLSGQMYNPESIALNHLNEMIVADTGNARVNVYSVEGHFRYQLGNEGQNKGEFEKPVSVSVDQEGYIYVADGHLKKIAKYSPRGVFLEEIKLEYKPLDITFDQNRVLYVLSSELGSIRKYQDEVLTNEMIFERNETNLLKEATGISVDEEGDIYLITLEDNSIYKFTQKEEMVFSFGSKGQGRGQFKNPAGIFYWQGHVYVPDTNNQRLQIFEVQKEESLPVNISDYDRSEPLVEYVESYYVSKFISDLSVSSDQEFYALSDSKGCIFKNAFDRKVLGLDIDNISDLLMPKAFAVKESGEILIADTKKNRVQFLNSDGSYGYKFGIRGKNQSQFNHLEGIAIHKDGYIYIADTDNHRIQVFNSDGIYLNSFGEKTILSESGNPSPGTFLEPKSLEFDSQGKLFVLDYRNKRIQIFDHAGKYLNQISLKGLKNQFKDPVDIAIDENDYLYVADRGDHSIKIFDPEYKFVYKFGSEGRGPSYFPNLSAVDSLNNKIYVADYTVESVQVFAFNPSLIGSVGETAGEMIKPESELGNLQEVEAPVISEQDLLAEQEESSGESEIVKEEVSPEKLFLSRVTYALGYINLPHEAKMMMLRRDLAQNGMFPEDILQEMIIESEDEVDNGQVRIVISVPKK